MQCGVFTYVYRRWINRNEQRLAMEMQQVIRDNHIKGIKQMQKDQVRSQALNQTLFTVDENGNPIKMNKSSKSILA